MECCSIGGVNKNIILHPFGKMEVAFPNKVSVLYDIYKKTESKKEDEINQELLGMEYEEKVKYLMEKTGCCIVCDDQVTVPSRVTIIQKLLIGNLLSDNKNSE